MPRQDRYNTYRTDGLHNVGDNPEEKAMLFPKLNVLCLPRGDLKTCKNLAKIGKGKLIKIDQIVQIVI